MSKVTIVYWSGTGNTAAMAQAVADGVKEKGGIPELLTADLVDAGMLKDEKVFALGCPAMGAEQLEESVMEPLMAQLDGEIVGKSIGLFGSYEWADGEWMRLWQSRVTDDGATIVGGEGTTAYGTPDAEGIENCKKLGRLLVEALG